MKTTTTGRKLKALLKNTTKDTHFSYSSVSVTEEGIVATNGHALVVLGTVKPEGIEKSYLIDNATIKGMKPADIVTVGTSLPKSSIQRGEETIPCTGEALHCFPHWQDYSREEKNEDDICISLDAKALLAAAKAIGEGDGRITLRVPKDFTQGLIGVTPYENTEGDYAVLMSLVRDWREVSTD